MPYKNPKQQAAIAISMKKAGKKPKEIAKHMNKGGVATTKKKKTKTKTKSRVNESGNYTKPTLRKRLFEKIKAGSKGGKPGQWSARKAQMLAREYKAAGGGYK
jgi:hypothetical protein